MRVNWNKVTRDWNSVFTMLKPLKSRIIARRIGPLLQGVNIDPVAPPAYYRPMLFLHPLGIELEHISLFFVHDLKSLGCGSELIETKSHSEKYVDRGSCLLKNSMIPFHGSLRLNEFIDGMRVAQERNQYGLRFDQRHLTAIVQLCIYYDKPDSASCLVEELYREMSSWPSHVFEKQTSRDDWMVQMNNLIENRKYLEETVDAQVRKHNVDAIDAIDIEV